GQRCDTEGSRPALRGLGRHRRTAPTADAAPPAAGPAQRRLPGQGARPASAPCRLPPLRPPGRRADHQASQRQVHLLRGGPRPGQGSAPHHGPPGGGVRGGVGRALGGRRPVL
ncbi:MAG: hypothetical protein AVDCRST_MAG10-1002, partial [uncultured Acidimicrobiales bacterium]